MSELVDRLQEAVGPAYHIESELGGGGMSRVFLAEETALKRRVVIKVLPPEMAAGVNKERFQRETQLAASLQHPLIVPILTAGAAAETGEGSDLLYYVMPYIEGQSLREKLDREGELPVNTAARVLRDVADALGRAHAAGVVHRDIKPDNVMLSGKHAMVTDFGVAKGVSAEEEAEQGGLTQLGMALGTPWYMAPEQAAGDPNTDHRADLYSLGVMAYEMLSGHLPFEAKTPQGMLAAHVSQAPEPVRNRNNSIPPTLEEIVMRCLAKRPADRWQTAEELGAALEAVAGSSGSVTAVSTQALNIEGFVTRSSPLRVGVTFALASTVAVGVVYLLMIQLGLPDWTLWGAGFLGLAGVGLSTATAVTQKHGGSGMTWRRARATLASGLGVLSLAVIGYTAMRVLGIGPVGTLVASGLMEERDRLIITEFENSTSDSTLGETISELLRIDLAQSSMVTLMERQQISQVLRRMQRDPSSPLTFELAGEIAEREGVKAVLAGEIRSIGNNYVVSARLVAASTGETLAAGRETANSDDLINAVDKLSASLRERIGESLKTIRADAPLAQVTTRSNEALRKYAQADQANNMGNYPRAIALLEGTIEEDSLFAMAHRKLGIILSNEDQDPERAQAAFTRAYELRDRLTERERYLAEAAYYSYVADDKDASTDAYVSLLERYPTDRIALNNLAINYRSAGRTEEAEALYRESVNQGGAPAVTYTNAVELQYLLGMVDTATATLTRFVEEHPEHPQRRAMEAAFANARFDFDDGLQLLEAWRRDSRGVPISEAQALFSLGSIAAIRGRIEEARSLLLEGYDIQERAGLSLVQQPRPLFEAVVVSSIDLYFLGEPDRAAARLDEVIDEIDYFALPDKERDDLQVAGLYGRAGRGDRARELVAAYERDILGSAEPDDRTLWLWAAYGNISMGEGRYGDAVREFTHARDLATGCPICFQTELGQAYLAAGQPDSAIAAYERYLNTPFLHRVQMDNFNLWAVLIGLGEAYEATGNTARAVENYNRLVEQWKDADPELQSLIDDFKRRIARLVGEGR